MLDLWRISCFLFSLNWTVSWEKFKCEFKQDKELHVFNCSIWEGGRGRQVWVWGLPGLHIEFQGSQEMGEYTWCVLITWFPNLLFCVSVSATHSSEFWFLLILQVFFCFGAGSHMESLTWNSPYSQGWSCIPDPPASMSWVLWSWVCHHAWRPFNLNVNLYN